MDYTVSLQVQHQLAVFPTHFHQGYSVELQVWSARVTALVCFLLLSFFARFFLDCDERRAREFRSEWVWLYVDALLQGTSMVVVLHADIFNTEVLVARRILSKGAQRSCAAAGALRRTPGWKSEQSSLVALGWPYVSCNVPACWKGDSPWSIPEGVPLDKL